MKNRNYWLHRVSHCGDLSNKLLDNGILSMGFSDLSSEQFVEESSGSWRKFEKIFLESWGSKKRSRHSLWRFISGMKKGDYVVIPHHKAFSVFEITDEKCLTREKMPEVDLENLNNEERKQLLIDDDNKVDLGFFRRVKKIEKEISRKKYANSALTARLKIRTTNADISDLKESVENAIDYHRKNKPINIRSQIQDKIAEQTLETIKKYLSPDKLEKLIVWYFKKIGATDVFIPSKNEREKEGDADIIATFEPMKTIYYVQAKYHKGTTSNWGLNQVIDYVNNKDKDDDGYSKIAWVITTAEGYKEDCAKEAEKDNVQLFNGKDFTEMILDAGLSSLDEVL